MGVYDWVFWFDNAQVATHMTFGQRMFAFISSVQCRCDKICCVGYFSNHTENLVAKMLCLPQAKITKPPKM